MSAATTSNGAFPRDARQAARLYLDKGALPIPVHSGGKKPLLDDWPNIRPSRKDLGRLFPSGKRQNVGLLLVLQRGFCPG